MYSVFGSNNRKAASSKVFLNIYDLYPPASWAYSFGMGAHHSGVEVMGQEYSFYGDETSNASGIMATPPQQIRPPAVYRETIEMGEINLTSSELRTIIEEMGKEFTANTYNVTTKNCNFFSNALCMKLLNKPIPSWVNRLATLGGPLLKGVLERAQAASVAPDGATSISSTAFKGEGRKLRESTDNTKLSSSSSSSSSSVSTITNKNITNLQFVVDETKPTTCIQIRQPSGARIQIIFNHNHTINDIRNVLDSTHPIIGNYSLRLTFPRKLLTNNTQTIEEAGVINSVIIQELIV